MEHEYHYYPYGTPLEEAAGAQASSDDNPFRWAGKHWDEIMNAYDFGARYYSTLDARWNTMDPLCEKYYSISPYAYCAGDPLNLVDPYGNQWYSYKDEDGNTKLVFYEGNMPNEEKKQYNDIQYLGYTYTDSKNNRYYSLFGQVVDWTDSNGGLPLGQLYNVIDRLIITRALNPIDMEGGSFNKVPLYIDSLPYKQYTDFLYNGRSFSTIIPTGTGDELYIGNRFWNVNRENSWSYIRDFPDAVSMQNNHYKANAGYWLTAENPNSGAGKGFTTLMLKFSEQDAASFLKSYMNIFKR